MSELKSYTDVLAKRVPSIAQRVRIAEPGLSSDELLKLSNLRLPPVYARCIRTLQLFGVAVGYFTMWPSAVRSGDMVDALLRASHGGYPGFEEVRNSNLLVVAQEEANPVCVGRLDSSRPDVVYLLELARFPYVELQTIATDFEIFLLLVGNLHKIGQDCAGKANEGVAKMLECCTHFSCTIDEIAFWNARTEIAVS